MELTGYDRLEDFSMDTLDLETVIHDEENGCKFDDF